VVTVCTTRFNIQQFYMVLIFSLCVFYGAQNKQQILPFASLIQCFYNRGGVFTARYGLNTNIEQNTLRLQRIKMLLHACGGYVPFNISILDGKNKYHNSVTIITSVFCHNAYLCCFVWFSQYTKTSPLYSINRLVFVIENVINMKYLLLYMQA